jgi:uncharacterized protein (DUF111 family)
MRVAYFDCFAGISGNMVLGALLDADLELGRLEAELAGLGLDGYKIVVSEVHRNGLKGTHVEVETEEQGIERHLHDVEEIIGGSEWQRVASSGQEPEPVNLFSAGPSRGQGPWRTRRTHPLS